MPCVGGTGLLDDGPDAGRLQGCHSTTATWPVAGAGAGAVVIETSLGRVGQSLIRCACLPCTSTSCRSCCGVQVSASSAM